MANIKSAIKRIRTTQTKTDRNKIILSNLKTTLRKFSDAIESENKELANELFFVATKKLDRATSRGCLHANSAARKKSMLSKQLKTI